MNKNLRLLVSFAASDRLSGPLKNIVGLGQSGSEKLAAMKREARDMGRELRDVQGEVKRSTGNVTQLMNRERDLAERIARTNDEMERQTRLLKINARADAIKQRGADLRSQGTDNVITGVAMAAPMVLAAKQAITLESAMADVRKVVDFDTPDQFRQMGDDILDMSTRIPMAADGLAQIVAAAGRAGIARKELLVFAEDAAQMGIAFDSTAEEAGETMAKWRTAFGLTQDQTRTLADQINALTNTYGGNVGAVTGITTRIGALGKVAGLAAPEIAAMGQLMNSVGVEEEIAATGIKNMMLAMTKGTAATKAQKKAMGALGLDTVQVANAMQKDAAGAITDLLERLKQLPEAQQAATLTQLFGSESVAAIAPMLTNLDRLKENLALVGDKSAYAGSMQKEYLARIATTEGALGLAKNALSAVNITLGNMLLPTITAGAQKVVALANAVRGWAKENPGLAKGLMLAWTGATGLVLGIGALRIGLGAILGPFSMLYRLVGTNGPMLIRLFGGMRMAAMFLARGVMQAGIMMMANPLVLAIVAVVATLAVAGYMIYKHWDTIKAAFYAGVAMIGRAWEWIKEKFNAGIAFLVGLRSRMLEIGRNIISGLANGILAAPGAVWSALKSVVMGGISNVKALLGIKSPSRVFMGIGGFVTDGLALGIDRGKGTAIGAAKAMATGVAGAGLAAMNPATAAPAFTGGGAALAPMNPAAAAPGFAGGGAGGGGIVQQFGPVTIVIHAAPGQSPTDIADAVKQALGNQADGKAASRRSAFSDS